MQHGTTMKIHKYLFNHFPSCDRPAVKTDGPTLEGVISQHFFENTPQKLKKNSQQG
jgi:hypothetical protein